LSCAQAKRKENITSTRKSALAGCLQNEALLVHFIRRYVAKTIDRQLVLDKILKRHCNHEVVRKIQKAQTR